MSSEYGQVVDDIAAKYQRSAIDIVMRWGIQHDYALAPQLINVALPQWLGVMFEFKLTGEDMVRLDELHEQGLLNNNVLLFRE